MAQEQKEIPKDEWVLLKEKKGIGQFIYIPSNYPGPIALNANIANEVQDGTSTTSGRTK